MSEPKDPERLLADALRAQAVFAPQPERTAESSSAFGPKTPEPGGTDSLPPQYGLISGAGADSLERERAALDPLTPEPPTVRTALAPQPITPGLPLPMYWVLVLAVLLGLAAGSVVGLLTLL
ncbi:hypothetical protein [Amycolatopsis sp.]|jgi:hypothetical protein|uniref:hypothetical protein n=1 Tax=Amycolatopsis sp. TaxID=37632 RepID=UPI002DFC9EE2|nr:hypothetical protein [Amycolatopsis sp.]